MTAATPTPTICRRMPVVALAPAEPRIAMHQKRVCWTLNEGQTATEKLSDGIRLFAHDLRAWRTMVEQRLAQAA